MIDLTKIWFVKNSGLVTDLVILIVQAVLKDKVRLQLCLVMVYVMVMRWLK